MIRIPKPRRGPHRIATHWMAPFRVVRRRSRPLISWWHRQDQRWQWWWRAANLVAALIVLAGIALPIISTITTNHSYELSPTALKLVGKSDSSLTKQLSWNAQAQAWIFNAKAVDPSGDPSKKLRSEVGNTGPSGHSLYSVTVPQDLRKGITYTDVNSQLSFSLVPEFTSRPGRMVDGHIVYPLEHGLQAIYTLKNNGLKEDIYVPKATSNEMNFYYRLKLPKTLASKTVPDSNGALGIYSADPSLYGDISFGSNTDRAAVQKAREVGDKTYLVFALPSPVVNAPDGRSPGTTSARYEAFQDQLVVVADDMESVTTPVSIDPSVVVTSTSDFQTNGNNEGMIDFGTANQITRGGLTGGSVGSWSTVSTFSASSAWTGLATYNGYFYVVGRYDGTFHGDCYYAALNSDGTVGTKQTCTSLSSSRDTVGVVAYSGYLYAIGGNSSGTEYTTVEYAPINANGSIGSWTATTSLPTPIGFHGTFVYNDYLYSIGGTGNSGTAITSTYYAPINANGTIGSWQSTTSLPVGRAVFGLQQSNGYVYVIGGSGDYNLSTAPYSTTYYAPINSDGTLGSWAATTALPGGLSAPHSAVYNGYLYIMGGNTSSGDSPTSAVLYAQINANGTVGSWLSTNSLATTLSEGSGFAYGGYLYSYEGRNVGDIEYAKIDPVGTATGYTTSGNTFTTTRRGGQAIAYNGFLYIMGGDSGGTPVNTIYAATINSDGSIGAFTATGMTAFTTNRTYFAAVAADGYMFVLGGCSSAYSSCTTASNDLATVYSAAISSTGTIGSWTAQTSFTTARYGLSAAAYNGYIYVMGGLNGGTFQNDIQYHALGASGAISGAWSTSAQTLPASEAYFGAQIYAGNLYIVGGCSAGATTCTTSRATVHYAAIASSGDLAGSLTASTSFTTARGDLGLAIINGVLYITGGRTNTTYSSDTQFAPISSGGGVGSWTSSSASTLATARYGVGTATYNGYLYVTGGYNGTTYYNNVQYAAVNNGGSGTLGTFAADTHNFTTGRSYHASAAYNGYLYIVGGENASGTVLGDTQYAPMNSDGSLGSFTTDTHVFGSSPTTREDFSVVAYNGYLYAIGGRCNGGCYYGDIQYAPIGSSGALTANWTSAGGSFVTGVGSDTGRSGACSLIYNGYLYAIGGWDGNNDHADTRYAPINANGTVGTWQDSGNDFATIRSNSNCFTANGYLYLVGGDGTTKYNDVQSAPVNSNGTIGSWMYTASFNGIRSNFVVGVANGFVYLTGGVNASNSNYTDTQYAPINAGGKLGAWQYTKTLITDRSRATGFAYNGYLYISGGTNGTNQTSTEYAPLNSIARIAKYSKLIDLGSLTNVSSITYTGTVPTNSSTPGIVPITYKAAGTNAILGSSNPVTTASGSGGCIGNVLNTRYLLITVNLDDSGVGSGIFPDGAGTASNLTDLTVNYNLVHPPPNIRLRGGQTLQSGNLSPFDTCYP